MVVGLHRDRLRRWAGDQLLHVSAHALHDDCLFLAPSRASRAPLGANCSIVWPILAFAAWRPARVTRRRGSLHAGVRGRGRPPENELSLVRGLGRPLRMPAMRRERHMLENGIAQKPVRGRHSLPAGTDHSVTAARAILVVMRARRATAHFAAGVDGAAARLWRSSPYPGRRSVYARRRSTTRTPRTAWLSGPGIERAPLGAASAA
jgi:hypothetical protein